MRRMYERFGEKAFLLLICANDWICLINYEEYKACIDENFVETEWLEVTRPDGGGFRVRGKNGTLSRVVPLSDFPRVLFQ
ncbi:hypothetical protein BSNK01_31790 [Bacillaceae bacterium]